MTPCPRITAESHHRRVMCHASKGRCRRRSISRPREGRKYASRDMQRPLRFAQESEAIEALKTRFARESEAIEALKTRFAQESEAIEALKTRFAQESEAIEALKTRFA